MSVGETVPAEVTEEQPLDQLSHQPDAWNEIEDGLLDTVRELGGIAAEAAFRLENDGEPVNGVRLTALLDHISKQVRELRATIEPKPMSPVDDLLHRLNMSPSANGEGSVVHYSNGTNGNGKHPDIGESRDWSSPFSSTEASLSEPAHSNGNGSHPNDLATSESTAATENGSTAHETTVVDAPEPQTVASEPLPEAKQPEVSDENKTPSFETLELTEREKKMLQLILDNVPEGQWFSSKELDFSQFNFGSRNALNQAFSQLKYKLTKNGLMEVTGETKARRYLLIRPETNPISEPESESIELEGTDVPAVSEAARADNLTSTEPVVTETSEVNTTDEEDPFERYTSKLLQPQLPSRMEVGAKPEIIVLTDNKVKIGNEIIELSPAETAVMNMLLHHRSRLKVTDMFDMMGDPDGSFRNEFKGALHKIHNLIENLLGEGAIEREGHTKATTYRLSLTTVIADLRRKSPPGGTPDFLAQRK